MEINPQSIEHGLVLFLNEPLDFKSILLKCCSSDISQASHVTQKFQPSDPQIYSLTFSHITQNNFYK
jgi:hypothetical protein